jgi:hypothetical protein
MNIVRDTLPAHDPLEVSLSSADDRVRLSHWMPPQAGVMPKVRIGRHWVSLLWGLPAAFVILIVAIALAQALRQQPSVQAFLIRYPGAPVSVKPMTSGFPSWLRLSHFLNLFFMIFIIRAGIPDLGRSSKTLLETRLYAGDRVVPFSKRCANGPRLDRQRRLRDASGLAGNSRYSPFHRPCQMVAFLRQSALDAQRRCHLHFAFLDRPVATHCPHHVGRVPERDLDRITICLAKFSSRSQLDTV